MFENINFVQQSLVPHRKVWDILGQSVVGKPTTQEVLQYSGLDFQVAKAPNTRHYPSGKIEISSESFFTYRTDTDQKLADHVGKKYQVIQNRDAFNFFDNIAGKDGVFYETAGSTGNGARVFITAKLPDYIRVGQTDDVIEQYILLCTTHDGTGAVYAALSPIRLACHNALNAALNNSSLSLRIPHTKNAEMRLLNAQRVMGLVNLRAKELEQTFTNWSTVQITDRQVRKLIEQAMGSAETLALIEQGKYSEVPAQFKRTCDTIFQYYSESPSQLLETTQGTPFGVYNAVTGYFQNVKSYGNSEQKMASIFWGGQAQRTAQKAFNLCNGFAKFGADALILN